MKVHLGQSCIQDLLISIFCQYIRWILSTQNFGELNLSESDLVLDPEVRTIEMPDLSKTFSASYADSGSGIAPNS